MSAHDHRLYFLLQTTAAAMKKSADAALLDCAGLTTAQAAALVVIREHKDGVSLKTLAKALSQRESAMTTMSRRLEANGFIARQKSDTDQREWRLTLTALGEDTLQASRQGFDIVNAAVDAHLSTEDLDQLVLSLRTLRRVFARERGEREV